MKKSLYIISELFPPDETSTSYILGEIANACAIEYEVHVVCGPEVYDSRKAADTTHPFYLDPAITLHRVEGAGTDKNRLSGKALSFFLMSHRLMRMAKSLIKEGDKVLLVTNPAPLVLKMANFRSRRSFELTLLVHDVFPENTVPAGIRIPGWIYRMVKDRFDKAYRQVDRFITLGRDMAEVVRRKAGNDARVAVVENWAQSESISPKPFPGLPIKVGYAGNIGRVQGLEQYIQGVPDGVELHFYGTGALEKKLQALNLHNVFFHGPYFRSQQQDILGSCHAGLVTLQEDMYGLGVPSKAYNIMAAGRPIIYLGPVNGEIGLTIKENRIGYLGWPKEWDMKQMQEIGERARNLSLTT